MEVVTPAELRDGSGALHAESGGPRPALLFVDLDDADWGSIALVVDAVRRRHARGALAPVSSTPPRGGPGPDRRPLSPVMRENAAPGRRVDDIANTLS